MSLVSQVPEDFLGLSASQWFWLALAGWALAIVLGGLIAARLAQGAGDLERVSLDAPALLRAVAPDEDAVAGVLRWLRGEVDADAVAHLEMSPRGERLRIEPRGLDAASVARIAELARASLLGDEGTAEGVAVARWLGAGGTNVVVAAGATASGEDEPFRFSRYLLEWVRAADRRGRPDELEDRLRRIPGVVWVEVRDRAAHVLAADGALGTSARAEVERRLEGTGIAASWIEGAPEPVAEIGPRRDQPEAESVAEAESIAAEPIAAETIGSSEPLVSSAIGTQEPRIRLLDVALSENGEATAEVRVTWNEREIRGRGHGRPTRAGRYFAAAQAVADALRPLLDTRVEIEGLYVATTKEGVDVLIAEVRLEGERYVGAVLEQRDQPDWTGARAVLDAVNRRLVQVAGRSGRV